MDLANLGNGIMWRMEQERASLNIEDIDYVECVSHEQNSHES